MQHILGLENGEVGQEMLSGQLLELSMQVVAVTWRLSHTSAEEAAINCETKPKT